MYLQIYRHELAVVHLFGHGHSISTHGKKQSNSRMVLSCLCQHLSSAAYNVVEAYQAFNDMLHKLLYRTLLGQ